MNYLIKATMALLFTLGLAVAGCEPYQPPSANHSGAPQVEGQQQPGPSAAVHMFGRMIKHTVAIQIQPDIQFSGRRRSHIDICGQRLTSRGFKAGGESDTVFITAIARGVC